eukprot:CAMPEP_0170528832 /NCGR_PEP_ID=MMETSP0209-20121228/14276_1 /TAXON_ID=665100 ORGANISM="Litonotus pictus, Strain P1" /NCGR_SAMPLE_ID=MMETSP0209 /ASSEMBLY_ACC=CAM_ASM_000301 /LENGTH=183 /DNA_ID=CAMNT_0010820239 /DNA_START=32 /DNA_END=579 /DNA_ORIENTATION=-
MKFTHIILLFLCIELSISKSENKSKTNLKSLNKKNKSKVDILGEAYTVDYLHPSIAIADSNAKVQNLKDDFEEYGNPQMVKHISDDVKIPSIGPMEAVEEMPTTHQYYDGSLKLNKVKINCTIYATKNDCIHQSFCGWCGSSSSCLFATKFGPETPCLKSSFIVGQPYPNWNNQIRRIDEPVG